MGRRRKSAGGFDAVAYSKNKYEQRKSAGLCVACGETESGSDSVYCETCLQKQRNRQKVAADKRAATKIERKVTLKNERKKAGVCLDCGADRNTKFRCRRCYTLYLIKRKDYTRYDARRKAGLCGYCDNLSDGPRCEACQEKRNSQWHERKKDRLCAVCGKENDRHEFATCSACSNEKIKLYADRKANGLCPHCGDDKPIAPGKHCKKCRRVNRKKDRNKARKLREQVLEAYGGKCKCCGEAEQAFLQVDHVNNDGAKHRRELFGGNKNGCGVRFYTWLRKNGFPKDRFQLLCANCNIAKARYGVCPHQKKL